MIFKIKKIINWLNKILFLGALLFLFFYLKQSISKISVSDFWFNGLFLFLSFLFILSAQYLQALLWHWITCDNGCSVKINTAVFLRLKNEILKYIPGKISQVGSIIIDYDLLGASKSKVAFSVVLENMFSLFGGVLASIFLVYCYTSNFWFSVLLFTILLIIIILGNKIFITVFFKIYSKIKKTNRFEYQSNRNIVKYLFLYFIVWLIFGLGFFFLLKSVYNIENEHLLLIVFSFSASSLIGFIVFFVPAGLGFREGGLVFFLRDILPTSIILIPIILSRIQIVICDLISLLISYLFKLKKSK